MYTITLLITTHMLGTVLLVSTKCTGYNNLAESNSTCNYVGNVRTFTRAEAERAFAVDILFTVAATVSALILI